jgi:Rrf2 family iron-sulfur cluster assembly transcriptional regulator
MKLTSKGRYAVIAMLDLALEHSDSSISLMMISKRQKISLSYLEQIFAKLKKANLVVSCRGPGGGYSLSREADKISINEIISAVDERLEPKKCAGKKNCKNGKACLSHHLWDELSAIIESFLNGVSLQYVIDRRTNVKEIKF